MALRTQWRQVKRFAEAAAMHRRTAEALLAGCGTETESELAYMAIYHLGYSVECLLKARFLSAIRPKRHKRALEVLKKSAGHDIKQLVRLLGELRKPVNLPMDVERRVRLLASAWNSGMRYEFRIYEIKRALPALAIVQEVEKWCDS